MRSQTHHFGENGFPCPNVLKPLAHLTGILAAQLLSKIIFTNNTKVYLITIVYSVQVKLTLAYYDYILTVESTTSKVLIMHASMTIKNIALPFSPKPFH